MEDIPIHDDQKQSGISTPKPIDIPEPISADFGDISVIVHHEDER